jgi:DNA-binding transcriptional LysR family regulator
MGVSGGVLSVRFVAYIKPIGVGGLVLPKRGKPIYREDDASRVRLKARPCITFEFDGGRVTARELMAIEAVFETGSQLEAARALKVSVPVLHRRLSSAEAKVGDQLVITDNRGTHLTDTAIQLIHAYEEYCRRSTASTFPIIACTPVTEQRVHRALSRIERESRRVSVVVGDDESNTRLFVSGQVDLLVLDDPQFAYESFRNHLAREVGTDRLLMVDRGDDFARFRYGPQRLGFEHLDSIGRHYQVTRFVSDIDSLIDSGLSFFLNESLALRKGIRRVGSVKSVVEFAILSVIHEDSQAKVSGIIKELVRGS